MSWGAINERHAIERVRFEIAFVEPVPSKAVEATKVIFDTQRSKLRFDAPQNQNIHDIFVGSGPALPAVRASSGWIAFRLARDGTAAEALALSSTSLVYESTDYRGWTTVRNRFLSVVSDIVLRLAEITDIRSFAHDYTDRFVFNGDVRLAKPDPLFVPQVLALLSPSSLSGEQLWHLHRGWFERHDQNLYLVNQNVDAQQGRTIQGAEVRSILILTKAELRPSQNGLSVGWLDAMADQLHGICNRHFANLLSDIGRQMVGIDAEGNGIA